MGVLFSTFFHRAGVVAVAAAVFGVVTARAFAAPSPEEVAYQKAISELKSGDASRVAAEVAVVRGHVTSEAVKVTSTFI